MFGQQELHMPHSRCQVAIYWSMVRRYVPWYMSWFLRLVEVFPWWSVQSRGVDFVDHRWHSVAEHTYRLPYAQVRDRCMLDILDKVNMGAS